MQTVPTLAYNPARCVLCGIQARAEISQIQYLCNVASKVHSGTFHNITAPSCWSPANTDANRVLSGEKASTERDVEGATHEPSIVACAISQREIVDVCRALAAHFPFGEMSINIVFRLLSASAYHTVKQ